MVKKTVPVIFQPTFDLSLELTLTENLVTLNPSKSRLIKIPVFFNPTAKDLFIHSGSLMGNLERAATAILLELKPIKIPADMSQIEVNIEAPNNETKWLPGADLSNLPEDQRVRVENLLDECDVFSKNDSDIGTIEKFKLKLNVTDPKPVRKPYWTIPKQLYSEVKQYLEDLITNNWIKTSYSSYTSPMVCIRKKDSSTRLCIDYREFRKKDGSMRLCIDYRE